MLVLKSLMEPGIWQIVSGKLPTVVLPKIERKVREKRSFFADFDRVMGAGAELIVGPYRQ